MGNQLIDSKIAIVTGSTKGIGLATAEALLERNAFVLVCGRKKAQVEATVDSLGKRFGSRVNGVVCDVRRCDDARAMFETAKETWGGVDILINNVGIGSRSLVENMSNDEWQSTIDTNLSGVFFCCREAVPAMKARGGGYIINIGSLAGKNAFAGGAAYCASKFGLIGFSEALMQEVRLDHIRVSCVMPGSVNTTFGQSGEQDPSATWKLHPEDVAQVVVNLLETDPRALASRVELRPSEPKQ